MNHREKNLQSLDARFSKIEGLIERGFGVIASEMATKDQIIDLHTQVNSIETQLRQAKVDIRLADLEQKVFGKVRA